LLDHDVKDSLSEEVQTNFNLWQNIVEKVIEKETKHDLAQRSESHRILSYCSQNSIRYTAGSLIRNLIRKHEFHKNNNIVQVLSRMLKSRDDIDDADTSEQWLRSTDHGGLVFITDMTHEHFIEIEVFLYFHFMKKDVKGHG
jgi:hypothetical protein